MHFRSILSGTLAVLLLSGAGASARDGGLLNRLEADTGGFSLKLPKLGLPGVFGERREQAAQGVQVAQSGGTAELQDQIRALNGKIEELNFQVLQMQEQIRKQQEDNEFRLQQLEQGSGGGAPKQKSDAGSSGDADVAAAPAPAPDTGARPGGQDAASGNGQGSGEVIVDSGTGEPGKVLGAPERTFGTITVDKNGNVVNTDQQAAAPAQNGAPAGGGNSSDGTVVAALPPTNSPDELYRNSYQFILSGDYSTAEQGFRDHISRFPKDAKAADAHYWLGEALLGQQKYRDAAETFLAASKQYPKAKKAPDMLLKLGVSLVGLKQKDVACATFNEVGKRYPDISAALKERVKQEKALAAC